MGHWLLTGCSVVAVVAVVWLLKAVEWAWWRPRRLGRALTAQGLRGTDFRLPFLGDLLEEKRLMDEAGSRPMAFSHDIFPRALPLIYRTLQQYGELSFTWFGGMPRVMITDPDQVKEVLSNKHGHIQKLTLGRVWGMVLDGLVGLEGDEWALHRKILNPAFHLDKLKGMLPAFWVCCDELICRWEGAVGASASGTTVEIDVWPEMKNLTADVISRTAFGSSFEEGRRIFHLQCELISRIIESAVVALVPTLFYLPTKSNKRLKAINGEIEELLRGIILKRQRAMAEGGSAGDDLLGLLLQSNKAFLDEDGRPNAAMRMEDVIVECKLFYFAGSETTSVLLTWTMVALSMHQEWQQRAREEVLQVFGGRKPDFDGINQLKIVTMVLYEVLRLYPPVMLLQRKVRKETELGGIKYPPGVLLALMLISVHRDTLVWGEDAGEFNPGRFAGGVAGATKGKMAFYPFGGGTRICIGQGFALLEAKIALCMILQRFQFELSGSYAHAPQSFFTLHPQHGAPILLRSLSN